MSPSTATEESDVKKASFHLAIAGMFAILAAPARGQAPSAAKPQTQAAAPQAAATAPASAPATVSRTTKAVNYRRAGGSTKIDFSGTELMQGASGEAKVDSKSTHMEIE